MDFYSLNQKDQIVDSVLANREQTVDGAYSSQIVEVKKKKACMPDEDLSSHRSSVFTQITEERMISVR